MLSVTKLWIWLSLSCVPRAAWAAWRHFGSVERVYLAERSELKQVPGLLEDHVQRLCDKSTERAERILGRCEELGLYLATWDDELYPQRLREIHLPPMVLYFRGQRLDLEAECVIAMAGTRRCTAYGRAMAEHFSYDLTAQGALVLTGMASGCDEAALIAAMRAGGPVGALLPGGVDVPFEDNAYYRQLYRDVMQMGVLVSPYPPGTRNDHKHFFYRNPILTGLSEAVLCVEAGVQSGVLNVASHASEQQRTLYVVPANLDTTGAAGTNALLCSGIALPVMRAADILLPLQAAHPQLRLPETSRRRKNPRTEESARPAPAQKQPQSAASDGGEAEKGVDTEGQADYIDLQTGAEAYTPEELTLLLALQSGEKTAEELSAVSELGSAQTLSALTMLTLQGAVEERSGGRFRALVRIKDEAGTE